MAHHFELAGSRRGVSIGDQPLIDGRERLCETLRIEWLGAVGCRELNRSQFVRLSQELEEYFPDLRGTQVQRLRDLCLLANSSEEFFLSVSREQWLRTVIKCDKALFSTEAIDPTHFISSITIHSIVVPCHPYWPKLQAVRDEAAREVASKRLYFPSTCLEVALSNQKSLVDTLNGWSEREKQCAILNQLHERDGDEEMRTSSRPFWNITPDDVQVVNLGSLVAGAQAMVGKVSWRGGIFIKKDFKLESEFDIELGFVLRVSHPHVVHSFGLSISTDTKQYSLLMESLDRDLSDLIADQVRLNGLSTPPFSLQESIDILLQIARAITHIHGLAEPVIHGDLKPKNILVSHYEILGDVHQYLVKVADFGSARILSSSRTFNPDAGTTKYAAPEILKARGQNSEIQFPKKIDVYSFGVVAFKILTGLEPYEGFLDNKKVSNTGDLKTGVIAGKLRPLLREACRRPKFWNDPDLMALVESCWHHEPSARPEFSEVTDGLESIQNNLKQSPVNGAHIFPPAQTSTADDELHSPRIGAHAFAPPEANAINGAPQNSQNGAHVLPPAQENAVNGGPQNQTIRMHASPQLQANATLTTIDGVSQEPRQSRRRVLFKTLCCASSSRGSVIE